MKQHFVKAYTRDTTIIIQESWGRASYQYVFDELGWENKYLPLTIHYFHNGTIEIWENEKGTSWLKEKILEENKKDEGFYNKYGLKFEKDLATLKEKYFQLTKLNSLEELKIFIKKVDSMMLGFIVYYYSAINEKTPDKIKKRVQQFREKETFFNSSSELIRNSLINLYPNLKGKETAIFETEIATPPNEMELRNRLDRFLVVEGKPIVERNLQNYIKSLPNSILVEERIEDEEIKGNIAYPGKVSGSVYLLFRKEDVDKLKEGDILVSPMTTPNFLPAMQKAAAFVTDEGGVTCHAAIMARELRKPCIVGTKIATKILKDGDMVEVDANKGVVKILK